MADPELHNTIMHAQDLFVDFDVQKYRILIY
jgi:hypothetical protein